MTSRTPRSVLDTPPWTVPDDIPIMYEDEEEGDMGETNLHVGTNEILHICLGFFLARRQPHMQVFANMNCYYLPGPPHPRTG